MTQKLSDAELEIMKIIWENKEETTLFSYLMEELAAQGKPCQKNTLIVLLSRLVGKGYLSATKIGRRNEYVPLISETAYQTAQTQHFIDKVYEGSVKGLVTNLITGDMLTEEEYEELKKIWKEGGGDDTDFEDGSVHVFVRNAAHFRCSVRGLAFKWQTGQTVAVLYLADCCDAAFASFRAQGKSDETGIWSGRPHDSTDDADRGTDAPERAG